MSKYPVNIIGQLSVDLSWSDDVNPLVLLKNNAIIKNEDAPIIAVS